ncbi:unnamed protein product [Allacma fusca]|uniref:ZAD domain-containing protein n=1 Tax=Allacma fusca TaxID=39272 RepID=A0A8J2J980_9HEXA|nr:unnamed protein product [Allacma fusca]
MARNKNMMKLKSLDDIPGEKVQCLVCLSDVGPNTSCVPLTTDNFMRDVIQIFGISNSWTSLNLSPENTTCCSSCYQIIDEAKGVSEEVSNLQLTLSSLLDSLKHLFKRSYRTFNQQQEPEDMGQTIRHALVQCWTPCEVRIKKLSIKTFNKNCQIQESQNKVKSGNVDSHYMGHMNTKDHSIVKLTSINRVVSGDTEIVGGKISAAGSSKFQSILQTSRSPMSTKPRLREMETKTEINH